MAEFRVWAPNAERVRLRTAAAGTATARDTVTTQDTGTTQDTAMTRSDTGWWSCTFATDDPAPAPATGPIATTDGIDYGFLIDDDPTVLPDPRSRRQPDGVHGMSRTYRPDRFAWTDTGWTGRPLAGGVIYELHIGTFTTEGTFDAAIERLDHLVELGIDFVEVLPVNAFNGTHNWGYDGVAWYAVQETYGGPAGYQRFVDACHGRGLGVIQDVVYNHLGPSGNYLPRFGPYLHDGHANTWGSSVNLDGPGSDEVRRYILDNVAMWLRDYHVDGLRLDAVHALADHRAVHLLEEMAVEAAALSAEVGRPLTLIAESDLNDPRLITGRGAGGYGLDAQWNDDYHHVLHVALTGETVGYYADFGSMAAIAKVLRGAYFHDGTWSSFRGRSHGRPVNTHTIPTSAFVGYTQDHDQIGNRATGDRLAATLDTDRLAIAAVMTLAGPFTPMLFMGEEWAASTPWQFFTSHPEPELGEATAAGRIAEFSRMGWDPATVPNPQAEKTFLDSKLNWDEVGSGRHAQLLALYRELMVLRRCWPQLTDPRFDRIGVDYDDDARWLLMDRGGLQVAVNFSDAPVTVPVRPHGGLLLNTTTENPLGDGDGVVRLAPLSATLLAPGSSG